ncbi:MAG: hypothetical protein FJ190_05035 [Gammaproteobacteria bacterium]|nr:hypothetical protein [Gammaproteobacteria bacterium]
MIETHTPYTLYIYSVDRIGYNIRYDKDPIGSLTDDLERLQSKMFGSSVLFERLAMRLLQRFPMPEDAVLWQDTVPPRLRTPTAKWGLGAQG